MPKSIAETKESSGGLTRSSKTRCISETCVVPDGDEHGQGFASDEPREQQDIQEAREPLTQLQHSRHRDPLVLSTQEVEDIAELCLKVILDHEAEMAAVFSTLSVQCDAECGGQGLPASAEAHSEASGRPVRRKAAETNAEKYSRRRTGRLEPFAAYADVRPAYFQEPHVEIEAGGDVRAAAEATLSEEDLAVYTKRTVAVLLLVGPSPIRVDDMRKCWLATPQHLRKRNFAALVFSRAAKIMAKCFGLELMSFRVRGAKYVGLRQGLRFGAHLRAIRSPREEELRGFLLFLSTQFLSAQAELPLEALKSNLCLVGRNDLLRDFDEASLLKAVHFREAPHKLDSLGALLSECESLKYITLTRRAVGTGEEAGDALFLAPTHRLLQELQLESFRSECRARFGVEPPDTQLRALEGEVTVEAAPSQNETVS